MKRIRTQEATGNLSKMPEKMARYFAYGSTMNGKDLEKWCRVQQEPMVNLQSPQVAILQDYYLAWNYYSRIRNGGVANIVPKPGSHVEGVFFELSESDLDVIAQKEGSPKYYRPVDVRVKLREGRIVERVVTFAVREELTRPTFVPPTREYLEIVIQGAERHGLSAEWIKKLRSVELVEISS